MIGATRKPQLALSDACSAGGICVSLFTRRRELEGTLLGNLERKLQARASRKIMR